MSVASILETSIVIESRGGAAAGAELDAFLERAGIKPAPVTPKQLGTARQAWRRFGKGRHPAALNFGDCFAYALARTRGRAAPLQGRRLRPDRHFAGRATGRVTDVVSTGSSLAGDLGRSSSTGSGVGHSPDPGHRTGVPAPAPPPAVAVGSPPGGRRRVRHSGDLRSRTRRPGRSHPCAVPSAPR